MAHKAAEIDSAFHLDCLANGMWWGLGKFSQNMLCSPTAESRQGSPDCYFAMKRGCVVGQPKMTGVKLSWMFWTIYSYVFSLTVDIQPLPPCSPCNASTEAEEHSQGRIGGGKCLTFSAPPQLFLSVFSSNWTESRGKIHAGWGGAFLLLGPCNSLPPSLISSLFFATLLLDHGQLKHNLLPPSNWLLQSHTQFTLFWQAPIWERKYR